MHGEGRAVESRLRAALSLRALAQRSRADELLASALTDARALGLERLAIEIASYQAAHLAEDGKFEDAVVIGSDALRSAERLDDPLLQLIARLNLARAVRKTDPKRAEKLLREAAAGGRDSHGLEYATVYNELSQVLAQNGFAEEALHYSREAYETERKKTGGRQ